MGNKGETKKVMGGKEKRRGTGIEDRGKKREWKGMYGEGKKEETKKNTGKEETKREEGRER